MKKQSKNSSQNSVGGKDWSELGQLLSHIITDLKTYLKSNKNKVEEQWQSIIMQSDQSLCHVQAIMNTPQMLAIFTAQRLSQIKAD